MYELHYFAIRLVLKERCPDTSVSLVCLRLAFLLRLEYIAKIFVFVAAGHRKPTAFVSRAAIRRPGFKLYCWHSHDVFFFLSFPPNEANRCFPFIIRNYFAQYSCIACIMLLKPMLARSPSLFRNRDNKCFVVVF